MSEFSHAAFRAVLLAGAAGLWLAGCAGDGDPPRVEDDAQARTDAADTQAVEPITATALEEATAAEPACGVPRLREELLARAALADAQARRLAAEAQASRAKAETQRPEEPSPDPIPEASAETASPPSPPPPPEMEPEMAAVLDAPEAEETVEPLPTALLPGYDLSPEEAERAFSCIEPFLIEAYAGSGHALAGLWPQWERLDGPPFLVRDAFGLRWLAAFGNRRALGEAPFEPFLDREFLVGATLALPSFTVDEDGTVIPDALYLVEKMPRGFSGPYGNWRFTEIPPEGGADAVMASRGGADAPEPVICADCTARGLDAVYLTLTRAGTAPADEELPPLRAMDRPRGWYPSATPTPVLRPDGAAPAEEAETEAADDGNDPVEDAAEPPPVSLRG